MGENPYEILFISLLSLIFSLLIFFLEFNSLETSDLLLSVIVTGLFATFAIVFSLSILAIQHSSAYSPRLYQQFFGVGTVLYMALFIISIIYAASCLAKIKCLNIGFFSIGVPKISALEGVSLKVSFVLTFLCLISLIPYWRYLNFKIATINFLDTLSDSAIYKIKSQNKKVEIPNEIKTIDSIIMYAKKHGDYDTLQEALSNFFKVLFEMHIYVAYIYFEKEDLWSVDRNKDVLSKEIDKLLDSYKIIRRQLLSPLERDMLIRTDDIFQSLLNDLRSQKTIINGLRLGIEDLWKNQKDIDKISFNLAVEETIEFCIKSTKKIVLDLQNKEKFPCGNQEIFVDGIRDILLFIQSKKFKNTYLLMEKWFKRWAIDFSDNPIIIKKLVTSIIIFGTSSLMPPFNQNSVNIIYMCKEILKKISSGAEVDLIFSLAKKEIELNFPYYLIKDLDHFRQIYDNIVDMEINDLEDFLSKQIKQS